jgi:phosphoribosylamine--glycine ligase
MREHTIATADYAVFDSHEAASRHLDTLQQQAGTAPLSIVVKADGLAAGKGVSVCHSLEEAQDALQRMMLAREFGAAGERVVIEERLRGREVSLMAFCDGHTVVPMLSARDHKPVFDGDQGPNTGGMGVYAPAPDVPPEEVEKLTRTVLQPVVSGMAARGTPYVGVLYAGLMLTESGVFVLEFNCRFGDPETQVVLPLLATSEESGGASLFEILLACTEGQLAHTAVRWQEAACAAVVLASAGYPGSYATGEPISGLVPPSPADDVIVFHAGTAHKEGQIVTAGGRVLAVAATGDDLATALQNVYASVHLICFVGMHYRRDIGQRELQL